MSVKNKLISLKDTEAKREDSLTQSISAIKKTEVLSSGGKGVRGRPKTGQSKAHQLYLPDNIYEDFIEYCQKNGFSFSGGCKVAILQLLEKEKMNK